MSLYTDEQAALLAKGIVRPALLFRLVTTDRSASPETTDVIRLWPGVGTVTIDSDTVEDESNAVYYGAGEITGMPAIEQLINGVAQRVEFTLSGPAIDSRVVQLADDESETVRGGRVNIGLTFFDEDWQIALPTRWIWEGLADTLDTAGEATPQGRERSLTLSVGSGFTFRKRPRAAYYTDVSQKERSASDDFCERVNLYRQGQNKPWPRA